MLWRHLFHPVLPSYALWFLLVLLSMNTDDNWWTLMNTVRLWVPEIDRWKWRERSWVGIYYQRCEMCEQNDAEKLHNRYFVEAVILPGGLFEIAWGQSDRQRPTDQWERFTISFLFFSCFWTKYCVKCKQDRGSSVLARKETPWCHRDVTSVSTFLALCFCRKSGPVAL